MGKKCQVCGGPVVNGRCKYCGMPYRNDMELYHLNEDRSEHYRHSSAKVRKAMAESEIPLPDRNKTTKKPEKKAAVRTTQRTTQKPKKKEARASKNFWRLILVLIAAAGLLAEQWDTIEYRIEKFIYDTFDISLDFDSLFGDSTADETGENDGDDTVDTAVSAQKFKANDPYGYIFDGEDYVIGEAYTITEAADENSEDIEYEFTIEPGIYILESGWEGSFTMKIKRSSGKDETVKFDEADHEEKIELHAGDEVSVVSLDGQDNYLAMYQIQQYDE